MHANPIACGMDMQGTGVRGDNENLVLASHHSALDLYRIVELCLPLSDIEPEERVGLRGYRLDVRLDI